jgi:hypothetical protein
MTSAVIEEQPLFVTDNNQLLKMIERQWEWIQDQERTNERILERINRDHNILIEQRNKYNKLKSKFHNWIIIMGMVWVGTIITSFLIKH